MTATDESVELTPIRPAWVDRPVNLTRAVTEELVQRIVRGEHPPGSSLPPEPALGKAFSVSRTVIREAVKVLQEKGLVQIRQGAGTVVLQPAAWDMLDELVLGASAEGEKGLALLDDLIVTRRLLEADMAHVAARLATPDAMDQLRSLVDRMDDLVDDYVGYREHDRAFHDTIMRTSGNRIARAVVRSLESQVMYTSRYMGAIERDLCVASNLGHRRICARIAAHDPAGAAEAMFVHITQAWLVRRPRHGDTERLAR